MRVRLRHILLDVFELCALIVLCVAALPQVAYAYVDPSVMTYTVQALAGVAVALSAVAGVVFRRLRKRVSSTLGLDENSGKVIEPDVVRCQGKSLDECNEEMSSFWSSKDQRAKGGEQGYLLRFAFATIVIFSLLFSFLVAAPFELIIGNMQSMSFDLPSAATPLLVACFVVCPMASAVIALLPQRFFNVAISIIAGVTMMAWIQAMFMNAGLPLADGASVSWENYTVQSILGVCFWGAALVLLVVMVTKKPRITRNVAVFVCIALVVVQSVGLTGLVIQRSSSGDPTIAASNYVITQEGMFDVDSRSNVIVFVLDMFDTEYLNSAMLAAPDIRDSLAGFTWYRNSAGSAIPTRFGIPYLLTGVMPQVGQSYTEYVANRYNDSSFLEDVSSQGYDVGIYTDTFGPALTWESKASIPINVASRTSSDVDWLGTLGIMLQTSLYRNAPWVAKPLFWYHTDQVNQSVMGSSGGMSLYDRPYVMNDATFFANLKSEHLHINDRGEKGSFRFIHLLGAHWPYVMDENGQQCAEAKTGTSQYVGCMRIVGEYLSQLKQLGLFDTSTIIITADHGYWQDTVETCQYVSSPLLLIKPANSLGAGEAQQATLEPLIVDRTTPTGHIDYPATVMAAMGGEWQRYGTPVWDVDPSEKRVRQYFYLKHDSYKNQDFELQEYEIGDNVLYMSDWHRTGRVITNEDKRYHP